MNSITLGGPPPLYKFWTVGTSSGIRFQVWARSADEARAKVHDAVSAWVGLEPLTVANDNGRAAP